MKNYAQFRYDARSGARLDSLPAINAVRDSWVALISQNLRAGKYRFLASTRTDPGTDISELPAHPDVVSISLDDGTVYACPGREMRPIGHIQGLLGFPEIAKDGPPIRIEYVPASREIMENVMISAINEKISLADLNNPGRINLDSLEIQKQENAAIFVQALHALRTVKKPDGSALTIHDIFADLRLVPFT